MPAPNLLFPGQRIRFDHIPRHMCIKWRGLTATVEEVSRPPYIRGGSPTTRVCLDEGQTRPDGLEYRHFTWNNHYAELIEEDAT